MRLLKKWSGKGTGSMKGPGFHETFVGRWPWPNNPYVLGLFERPASRVLPGRVRQ